jgi:hypothetical protein
MLTNFDQNTIANMTAALEYVCKKIPPDKDTQELRRRIGDMIIASASNGRRSLIDLRGSRLEGVGGGRAATEKHLVWLRSAVQIVKMARAYRH